MSLKETTVDATNSGQGFFEREIKYKILGCEGSQRKMKKLLKGGGRT